MVLFKESHTPSMNTGFSPLVICGSAHKEGNTMHTIQDILGDVPMVHLCELNIGPYHYESAHEEDDFLPLIRLLVNHNPLVFATPVYWYSMSGRMKTFWDRITDLLYHHKELSNQLQGKTAAVVVSSSGGKPDGFEMPLEKTFAYLKMNYAGCWDYIFPMEKHRAHNEWQKSLALAQWESLKQQPLDLNGIH
jgi:multimeric flavodoxin WrbA